MLLASPTILTYHSWAVAATFLVPIKDLVGVHDHVRNGTIDRRHRFLDRVSQRGGIDLSSKVSVGDRCESRRRRRVVRRRLSRRCADCGVVQPSFRFRVGDFAGPLFCLNAVDGGARLGRRRLPVIVGRIERLVRSTVGCILEPRICHRQNVVGRQVATKGTGILPPMAAWRALPSRYSAGGRSALVLGSCFREFAASGLSPRRLLTGWRFRWRIGSCLPALCAHAAVARVICCQARRIVME